MNNTTYTIFGKDPNKVSEEAYKALAVLTEENPPENAEYRINGNHVLYAFIEDNGDGDSWVCIQLEEERRLPGGDITSETMAETNTDDISKHELKEEISWLIQMFIKKSESLNNVERKDYIKFVIAYDKGYLFSGMGLACDEAFELAGELTERYISYLTEMDIDDCYESLSDFLENTDFNNVWVNFKEDNRWKQTIESDIELWEKLKNKGLVLNHSMYLNECSNSKISGLYQLILNGTELYYGTLQEINAVVKSMIALLQEDYGV